MSGYHPQVQGGQGHVVPSGWYNGHQLIVALAGIGHSGGKAGPPTFSILWHSARPNFLRQAPPRLGNIRMSKSCLD